MLRVHSGTRESLLLLLSYADSSEGPNSTLGAPRETRPGPYRTGAG